MDQISDQFDSKDPLLKESLRKYIAVSMKNQRGLDLLFNNSSSFYLVMCTWEDDLPS